MDLRGCKTTKHKAFSVSSWRLAVSAWASLTNFQTVSLSTSVNRGTKEGPSRARCPSCRRSRLRSARRAAPWPWRSCRASDYLTGRSLGQHDDWLPFFDDIRGELRRVGGADVPHRVDRFGRDEQDVAGVERRRRLAFDLVLQRPFEDVD